MVRRSITRKTKRVAKSTLSVEAIAILECAESAVYLAKIWREISGCRNLKIKCFADDKSLVDTLCSYRSVKDKRLRIAIAIMRDMVEREVTEVNWVDTSRQLTDYLTKRRASNERLRATTSHSKSSTCSFVFTLEYMDLMFVHAC